MIQHFFDENPSSLKEADIIITPLPFDKGISSPKGTALGPEAILRASEQLELFDLETKFNFSESRIHTVPMPKKLESYESLRKFIHSTLEKVEVARQFYMGLGGDHSVTVPAIEYLKKKHEAIGLIQIDAHADLRNTYVSNPYSHACAMRRVAEILGPSKILGIGIRAICEEEYRYMEENKVLRILGNRPMEENLLPELNEKLARLPEKIFLSIDLDGLDPSLIPHVQTPVPGGLSWHQCMAIVRRIFERKIVIGADLVELAPQPGSHASEFLASLLCQKILSQVLQRMS